MIFKLSKIEFNGELSDAKVFDDVAQLARTVISIGSVGTTYKFLQELEHLFKQNSSHFGEQKQNYQDLILQVRLASYQSLPDDEIGEILKNHLVYSYKNDVDLIRLTSLIFVPFFTQEDFTRLSRMIRYLEDNSEFIGNSNFTLGNGKVVSPLISNWLKDYKQITINDRGSLNIITYVTQNRNCKNLSPDQLELLRYILNFYDWLRFKASKTSFISQDETSPELVKTSTTITKPTPPTVPKPLIKAPVAPVAVSLTPAIPSHGQDLEVLRKQMAVKVAAAPKPVVAPAPVVRMTPEEIKREVTEFELPAHKEAVQPLKPIQKFEVPKIIPKSIVTRTGALQSISQISAVDDLKKVDVNHLRQGQLAQQISIIKSQISKLAAANNLLPYYTVTAFEQSPLFKSYLLHGNAKFANDPNIGELTQEEFEAIADLKKEIERL